MKVGCTRKKTNLYLLFSLICTTFVPMKRIFLTLLLAGSMMMTMLARTGDGSLGFPERWVAKTVVTDEEVKRVGVENCFSAEPLSDETFQRMQGKSWKKDCTLKRNELRYLRLLHRNAKGQTQLGEMVVNASIAERVVRVFRKLYEAGYRIEKMVLIDDYDGDDERSMEDNNTSAFNFRKVAGTTKLSNHARGLAIDLNTRYNPYVTRRGVSPKNGKPYAFNRNRRKDIPYKIDHQDLAYKLFKAEGFIWGGDWKSVKDYQHFEYGPSPTLPLGRETLK